MLLRALAVLAGLLMSSLPDPALSQAACPAEDSLFVYKPGVLNGHGTQTKNMIRSVPLDICAGSLRGATAIMLVQDTHDWVEVGWREYDTPLRVWVPFIEAGYWVNGQAVVTTNAEYSSVPANVWSYFQMVRNESDTNRWRAYFDYGADGGWQQLGAAAGIDTTFTGATPNAETMRFGMATNAFDHHNYLKYKTYQNQWVSWTQQALNWDTIDGWHWVQYASNEYQVEAD